MLLKIHEVTIKLGLAPKTVRKFIRSGALHGIKIGRGWRVDQDDLQVFIAKRRT